MNVHQLILCLIFVLVNGDVERDVRKEEETRYNATVASYLQAVLSGAVSTLFPKITDIEKEEAERLLALISPFGDPSTSMPDNEEKLETNLCRNHRDRGEKLLTYVRKRYPTNLITLIAFRIGFLGAGDKNDYYCNDAANRNVYIKNASVINSHVNKLNVPRNKFIDNLMAVVYGNTTLSKLAILCCSYWTYKTQSVNAIPNTATKQFLSDYLDGYAGSASNYLCVYYQEGSQSCANLDIPPPSTNYPRFTSVYAGIIQALSTLTSLS